ESSRLESWSLRSTAAAWVSTVRAEIDSRVPISWYVHPDGDQSHDLAPASGEPVEVRLRAGRLGPAEAVRDVDGQPRREVRVARLHVADRLAQVGAGDGLRHVPRRHGQAEETDVWVGRHDRVEDCPTAG